jgi:glycosyltransferase involved in cell wall biosynthesis
MPPDTQTGSLIQTAPQFLWRGLPSALRRRVFARATGFLAPKPSSRRLSSVAHPPGLVIAGEFSRASGLGESARLMAEGARRMGLPVWTIDLPPPIDGRPEIEYCPSDSPPLGVPLVLHVNAPMLPLALLRLPDAIVRNRPIVGYWAWEMPEVPPDWRPALACVNQAWVPSRFTAGALAPLLPGQVRVVPPPLGIVPPVASAMDRSAFGLPMEAVVVLVSLNLASSFSRKNPFGAIAAFKGAFGDRSDRILLLKISHRDHAPADFQRIVQAARAPNIIFHTEVLSSEDNNALTSCADIVLSLHRGEGFGLVLAEAMLLGKPVIATGWSGNTDFMDRSNAALVGYRLVPARDDRSVYRGLWAEPNIGEAATLLRMLADDPDERRAMGERAHDSSMARLSGHELADAVEGLA